MLCVLMCVLDDEMNFTSFDLKIELDCSDESLL